MFSINISFVYLKMAIHYLYYVVPYMHNLYHVLIFDQRKF